MVTELLNSFVRLSAEGGLPEWLFGPDKQSIPVDLPESGEKLIGSAGQLVAAVMHTAGLYAQSEVLNKFAHMIDSIGALLFIFAFLGALVSWALYGNYRESLYFLIGPTLFLWILGAKVPASQAGWAFGDRPQPAVGSKLMEILDWDVSKTEYANKEPQVSWFFALYDSVVSEVVNNLVKLFVDTKNKQDLVIAARERMMSRIYYTLPDDRGFIQLIGLGMAGRCAQLTNIDRQLAQPEQQTDSSYKKLIEQRDQLRTIPIPITVDIKAYVRTLQSYFGVQRSDLPPDGSPSGGGGTTTEPSPRAIYAQSNQAFIAAEADRLIRTIKVDEEISESMSCDLLWKYSALAAFMMAERTLNNKPPTEDGAGIPWAEVKKQVGAALVYDACYDGTKTYSERQSKAQANADAANAKPRASAHLILIPGAPGTFLAPSSAVPKDGVAVIRDVTILETHPDGTMTVLAPNGQQVRGNFGIQESDIHKVDAVVPENLGEAVKADGSKKTKCDGKQAAEVSSKATEVVAAMLIRNTLSSSVFQKVTNHLESRGSWDPAVYRTVFGNVQNAEKQARRAGLFYFAGAIPYLQGVLMFLLAMTFPFFSIFLLMPTRLSSFGAWMAAWLWVKSWDVGFAAVYFLRELFWSYMQGDIRYNANIEQMRWDSPDLVYSVMFQNDPMANLNTYFHLISLFIISVPLLTAHVCLGASDIVEAFRESLDLKATQAGARKGRAARRMEASVIGRYITERKGAYETAFVKWALDNPGKNFMGESRMLKSDAARIRFAAAAQRIAAARYYSNENQYLHRNMLAAVTGRKMSYTHGLMGKLSEAYLGLRNEQFVGPTVGRDYSMLPVGLMDNRFSTDSFSLKVGMGETAKAEDQIAADRYDTDGQ